MEERGLTVDQAARRLGIHTAALLAAVQRGALVPVNGAPGGSVRFRPADVDAYARQAHAPLRPHLRRSRRVTRHRRERHRTISEHSTPTVQAGEDRFRALVSATAALVWIMSADGLAQDMRAWHEFTGQGPADSAGSGWLDAVHPEDREATARIWAHAVVTGSFYEQECRLRRGDGAYRAFFVRGVPVREVTGLVREWVCSATDVTEGYHNAADLHTLVETALDAIITINHTGRIIAFNPAAEKMFGYDRAAVLGQELAQLIIPPGAREQHRSGLARYVATGEGTLIGRRVEVTALRADGSLFPVEVAITRIPVDGPPLFTGYIRDMTERKRMESALQHQALHDALTGLPNRTLFLDRMQQALAAAHRDDHPLPLLLFDLNHFKEVNDTFGHHYGDGLLQQVAVRLRAGLREADTVARLGGDEFAVLLPGDDRVGAQVAVHKILDELATPFVVDGLSLDTGASIGIAMAPEHGTDAATLLRHADVAMYVAKRTHRSWTIYDPLQDHDSRGRLAMIRDLREAIANGALQLHFQPKVALATGRLVGSEALVRWTHPRHGVVPPDQFIPLAEEAGLIVPLTHWVLREAIRHCGEWQRRGLPGGVAVNLSMWNVHDPHLPETVSALLHEHAVSPASLRLELTESTIMNDATRALDVLTQLRALGVHVSVDDFGTGYSSLSYLKRLPVDELKIDKSFVRDMATDGDDAAIVASTIGLGRGLGLRVVAEGVETRDTWDLLAELGCDVAQGYYLSRPLPADAFTEWLHEAPWALA